MISGGEDALFQVEGADVVARLAAGELVDRASVAPGEAALLEKLISAEIAVSEIVVRADAAVAFAGDPLPWLVPLPDGLRPAGAPAESGLVVLVRRTSSLWAAAELASRLERLHLFVDLSFHHTVSIGPLVVPHETPCVSCLAGRVTQRWGQSDPPAEPAVSSSYARLSAALIATEIERVTSGDTSLVGWTSSWNLADRTARRDWLLTTAACPVCRAWNASGRIEL